MGLAARALASTLVVLVPSYVVERITNYYFLTSNPLFGDWSGLRIWLFIVLILAGSVVAGVLSASSFPRPSARFWGYRACYSWSTPSATPRSATALAWTAWSLFAWGSTCLRSLW